MQAELVPLPQRDQGADDQYPAGALIEVAPGPDLVPGVARDQVLEFGIERVLAGKRFIDPGIAEHLAALDHPVVAALFVVHLFLLAFSDCRCSPRGLFPSGRRSWPQGCDYDAPSNSIPNPVTGS